MSKRAKKGKGKATSDLPRKREARFVADPDEHSLIEQAAGKRGLLKATYMRMVVVTQARHDVAA